MNCNFHFHECTDPEKDQVKKLNNQHPDILTYENVRILFCFHFKYERFENKYFSHIRFFSSKKKDLDIPSLIPAEISDKSDVLD